jgi:phosphoglycolate phosphatase
MKYKYLLFDLDGTLVNTTEGVLKSAQYALSHFNISVELDELKSFFGPPLKYSFMTLFDLSEAEADIAIKHYLERYEKMGVSESYVFECVPSLLKELRALGYRIGVATSKYEGHAIETLKTYGIDVYFDYITGANIDETISRKHEVIEESLRRFGATNSRNEVLMIGDMKYDILGAKATGIDSFGIYTGTAQPDEHENAGATYIAYSFDELRDKLINEFTKD